MNEDDDATRQRDHQQKIGGQRVGMSDRTGT